MNIRRLMKTAVLVTLSVFSCAMSANAWDVYYDGSVLPNNTQLGSALWHSDSNNYLGTSACQNGILHLVDSSSTSTARFYREGAGLPAGTSVTLEARVKVLSSASPLGPNSSGVGFGVSSYGGQYVRMWPDKIGVMIGSSNYPTFYSVDMTQFHTIRLDYDSNARSFNVWVDGSSVLVGSASGGNIGGGIVFGAPYLVAGATSDSYWDYVAYTTVPEPSSLIALGALVSPLFALRRRRGK